MCVILSPNPKILTAAAESPPPITVVASASAIALATAIVPLLKFSNSNTPIGPFHITVLASLIASAYNASVLGPISNPMLPAGMFWSSVTTASTSLNSVATLWSTGNKNLTPFAAAFSIISLAYSILSASTKDDPTSYPWAFKNV